MSGLVVISIALIIFSVVLWRRTVWLERAVDHLMENHVCDADEEDSTWTEDML